MCQLIIIRCTSCNGAGVILYPDLLKSFANRIGGGFFILPSSVHEVILVPLSEDLDIDEIKNMVYEINREHLEEVDILSDDVYVYRMGEDSVTVA